MKNENRSVSSFALCGWGPLLFVSVTPGTRRSLQDHLKQKYRV